MKKKTYKAKNQARFNKKKVQDYAEELERLASETNEKYFSLSPQIVVDSARDEKSVLHECFNWDNKKAGESWRKQQARMLMNSIEIIIEHDDEEEQVVPAFINLKFSDEDEEKRRYIMADIVANDISLREMAIQQALNDLLSWQKRFKDLKELGEIFGAIKKVQEKLNFKISEKTTAENQI